MEIIKPQALKKGDLVGLTAPASPALPEKVVKAVEALEKMGLRVQVGETCYGKRGYLTGSDELRSREINEMFANPEIAGIICLRGGYGTPRILDKLDYSLIQKNPKVFVGFSDITAVHMAIHNATDLVTFHGPMGAIIGGDDFSEYSRKSWIDTLFGTQESGFLDNPPEEKMSGFSGKKAKGKLCGGNLSLIADTMGTPYEIDTEGKILFIEEIEEPPYQIDRMLTELRLAGKLEQAAGIILGDFADCVPEEGKESLTLEEIFREILPQGKPIIQNVKCGHCDPQMTLALHVEYEIDGEAGTLKLLERPTR